MRAKAAARTIGLILSSAGLLFLSRCSKEESPAAPEVPTYAEDFETLWSNFDQTYPYFDYKHIDWQSAYATYRVKVDRVTSNEEFINLCVAMLTPLRDLHVYLVKPDGTTVPTYVPSSAANFDANVLLQYFAKYNGHAMTGNWGGYAMIDSIPYFVLTTWANGKANVAEFDSLLEQYRDARAMIVDVRMNGGGSDALAYQVAGRFTSVPRITEYYQYRSGPRHADLTPLIARTLSPRGPWQFSGRVALLIGRKCFSSNESFIAAMREIPSVTLMGDTTGGASGNPKFFTLASGWRYTVSTWIAYTADTTVLEWRGIAPDVAVRASPADFSAGIDPVIDYAKAFLKQ